MGVSTRKKNKILFCVIGLSIAIGLTALVLASFSWALVNYISSPYAIGSTNLDYSAVSTYKIADGAVTSDKLAQGAVSYGHVAEGAISSSNIQAFVSLYVPSLNTPTITEFSGQYSFVFESRFSGIAMFSTDSESYLGVPGYEIFALYADNVYQVASYTSGLDRASLQTRIAKTANLSAVVDALRRLTIEQSIDGEALLVADKVAESFPQATTAFEDREGDRTVYVNKEIIYDAALVALQQTMRENDDLRQEIADMRTKLESLHASVEFILSQSTS